MERGPQYTLNNLTPQMYAPNPTADETARTLIRWLVLAALLSPLFIN